MMLNALQEDTKKCHLFKAYTYFYKTGVMVNQFENNFTTNFLGMARNRNRMKRLINQHLLKCCQLDAACNVTGVQHHHHHHHHCLHYIMIIIYCTAPGLEKRQHHANGINQAPIAARHLVPSLSPAQRSTTGDPDVTMMMMALQVHLTSNAQPSG